MRQDNSSNQTSPNDSEIKFSQEEIARLFDYPAIGQLFSEPDNRRLNDFIVKLKTTDENLERVIRYAGQTEADKAARASQAVKITLEFLRRLQDRQTQGETQT